MKKCKAYYHLPGLFEFLDLYRLFLPLFYEHREWFYDWCEIGSIYGAPADCLWGGGRVGYGEDRAGEVAELMRRYGISARLTFSNSLLREEHLADRQCNRLCRLFRETESRADADWFGEAQTKSNAGNGIIICSDLLLDYIRQTYPAYYFVSSTTKVITDFGKFVEEVDRDVFDFVVPDFRLNKRMDELGALTQAQKDKVEFLCNECCYFGCRDRAACYENVSRKSLGEACPDHVCHAPDAHEGYVFSKAMENPGFIGIEDIQKIYLPAGFSQFKIEGRSLGSAMVLEFLLYYMTKPEYQLKVREAIYLDHSLDLF